MFRFVFVMSIFLSFGILAADDCCDQSCGCSTSVEVDFLWWDAMGNQLAYGIVTEGTVDSGVSPIAENLTERLLRFNPEWKPGVRVQLAHDFDCYDLTLFGAWTWYETKSVQNTSFVLPSTPNAFLSFNSDFIGGVGASLFEFETGDVAAEYYFKFNRVDLGLLRNCCLGCNLTLSPFAAFTYIYTDEDLTIVADFDNQTTGFFDQIDYRTRTNYDGYGLTLGVDLDWMFYQCLSLHTRAGLTGLWGCYEVDNLNVESKGGTVASRDSNVVFQDDDWRGRLYSQIQLGIKYSTCICHCPAFALLGWEHQVFFNQTNWSVFDGQFGTGATLSESDLVLQGLVARAGFSF